MTRFPLAGKTVLVTRAKEQALALSKLIRRQGGEAIEIPLLAFQPSTDTEKLDWAIKDIANYQWLIFTSANGVRFFMERYNMIHQNELKLPVSIAVVGKKTEAALTHYQIKADLIPTDYVAEGLVDALAGIVSSGDRILLARGNLGRKVLNDELVRLGALVDDITVYETVCPKSAKADLQKILLAQTQIDYVTFTSSSTVSHYVEILEQLQSDGIQFQPKIACIGPIAARTAKDFGLTVDIIPPTYTIEALVEQLVFDTKEENTR